MRAVLYILLKLSEDFDLLGNQPGSQPHVRQQLVKAHRLPKRLFFLPLVGSTSLSSSSSLRLLGRRRAGLFDARLLLLRVGPGSLPLSSSSSSLSSS
tara:strand:+ start:1370 stop:1660 length:291 start_codon:yes stop_codon:yes gene_type:complete